MGVSNFPNALDTFKDPSDNTLMNQPGYGHAEEHTLLNDAVAAIEAALGTTGHPGPLLSGLGGGGGGSSWFPANPAGMTTITESPDEVTANWTYGSGPPIETGGTGTRTDLVLAQDQSLLAVRLTGDTHPRWLMTSDATDGLYMGDGTVDPYPLGVNLWVDAQSEGGGFGIFNAGNPRSSGEPQIYVPHLRIEGHAFYSSTNNPNTTTFSPLPTNWNNAFCLWPGNGLWWYDFATSKWIQIGGNSSIPYTFAGALSASTSPPVRPHLATSITGFSATLGTAGTSNTVVNLRVNGTVITTVTVTTGQTYAYTILSTPSVLQARTDSYEIEIATAGTGAKDLGGEIELN